MTIIRAYAFRPDAKRPTHYREAWYDDHDQEFVIHHGAVGQPGTTATEKVTDAEQAEQLLVGFQQQNDDDGYRALTDEEIEVLTVNFRTKGPEPTQIEKKLAHDLATYLTRILAWRGLGAVESWDHEGEQFTYQVHTPHRSKAQKLVPVAVKSAKVQAQRISFG